MSPAKDRLEALTGLRFVAAAAIYYHHLGAPAGAPQALVNAQWSGYWGVTLFFILSGFVLGMNYFDTMKEPTAQKTWSFAVARIARVYPLYFLMLLYWTSQAASIRWSLWFEHALTLQAWSADMQHAFAFNGPAWSVGVETFLYAMFPLVVPLLARIDRSVPSLLVTGALVTAALAGVALWFVLSGHGNLPLANPESGHRWLYRMPALRIGDFVLGILAARLFVRVRTHAGADRIGRWLTLAGVVAFALLTTSKSFIYASFSWDAGYVLPSVALILGLSLAPATTLARFLATPRMRLLGEASYAFYLVHWAGLKIVGVYWTKVANPSTVIHELFDFAGILTLAIGLHLVVEKPARDWLKKVLGQGFWQPEPKRYLIDSVDA